MGFHITITVILQQWEENAEARNGVDEGGYVSLNPAVLSLNRVPSGERCSPPYMLSISFGVPLLRGFQYTPCVYIHLT